MAGEDKVVGGKRLRARGLGIGGTIGEVERAGAPPVKIKWKAGSLSGAGKGRRKTNKRGPGGAQGRMRQKSAPGFRIEVKF